MQWWLQNLNKMAKLNLQDVKIALPKNFNKLKGNTSMIGGKISSFSGFLQVDSVDLSGIPCTDAERNEIEALLKEGVFV